MNLTVIPALDLTDAHRARWRQLQTANPACAGPHFNVEFVQAVAEVRDGIEVAVISDHGVPSGFVPYRRTNGNVGRPLADNFSDFQGGIVPPGTSWLADELVQQCDLRAFRFSNVPETCQLFEPFVWQRKEASYIDLSGGFEAYRSARRQAGSDEIQEALRKSRKVQREVGPLRFEPRSTDATMFRTLIDWKRAQLRALKLGDSFADPWVLPLLKRISETKSDQFQGMVSVLRAGDEILAINLGMQSRDIFHGWVTTYNRDFAKYSPGLIMVTQLAQYAEQTGIRRIEMGCGGEAFKKSLASGTRTLVTGSIDLRPVTRFATQGWMMVKEMLRDTPVGSAARAAFQRMRDTRYRVAPAFRDV